MWVVFAVCLCVFMVCLYVADPSTPFQAFFTSCLCAGIAALIVPCIYQIKWRRDNGVDLSATLETDPEKVKARMLVVMQFGHEHGIVGAFKEFNDIFRNYPQWELDLWEVFQAWYKKEIDHMLKHPDIYGVRMKADGVPYCKDKDPLYNADANDWEQFGCNHSCEDSADLDECMNGKRPRISSADALAFGIGLGAGMASISDIE